MFTFKFLGMLLLKLLLCLSIVVVVFAIVFVIVLGAALIQECVRGRDWFK